MTHPDVFREAIDRMCVDCMGCGRVEWLSKWSPWNFRLPTPHGETPTRPQLCGTCGGTGEIEPRPPRSTIGHGPPNPPPPDRSPWE